MIDQNNLGAAAAVTCAATYVFGFVLLVTLLAPSGYGSASIDPKQVIHEAGIC